MDKNRTEEFCDAFRSAAVDQQLQIPLKNARYAINGNRISKIVVLHCGTTPSAACLPA